MQNFRVLYESQSRTTFQVHERQAARILAEFFRSDVLLQKEAVTKNADILILSTRVRWEIKSPLGDGKRTIDNNLRAAARQSSNVVLDLRRGKMNEARALSRTRDFLNREHHSIKKLLVISKDKRVIDIL